MSNRVSNRGRHIVGKDIKGETLMSEASYVANAAEVGSVGRGIMASGFTIGGTAVLLDAGLTYRTVLAIYNNGADTLFIGPENNTVANMYPVPGSGGQMALNVTSGVLVYGKTDGTSTNVRIIEIG